MISKLSTLPQTKYLKTALFATVALHAVLVAGLCCSGSGLKDNVRATAATHVVRLRKPVLDDSWRPMLKAYQLKKERPGADMYDVFFLDRIKFQYPPTSLICFDALPPSLTQLVDGTFSKEFQTWLTWFSRAAILLTVMVAMMLLGAKGFDRVLCLALGATFYPLLIGYELGQIQVFLNLLGVLALWAVLRKQDILAGVLIGICCLVKPQWCLVLIWALARKKWKLAAALSAVCLIGLAWSVFHFGWQDHIRYLDVLKMLSRQGETFWPNQSMNGLMNRFLQFGDHKFFAPYHPLVHAATIISSIVLMALALWPNKRLLSTEGEAVDFSLILLAATMASPVAWGHHYGVFLGVFALTLPLLAQARPFGEHTMPWLLVSYLAISQILVRPDLIHSNRWVGLLGSHVYLGGCIFFIMLWALRSKLMK